MKKAGRNQRLISELWVWRGTDRGWKWKANKEGPNRGRQDLSPKFSREKTKWTRPHHINLLFPTLTWQGRLRGPSGLSQPLEQVCVSNYIYFHALPFHGLPGSTSFGSQLRTTSTFPWCSFVLNIKMLLLSPCKQHC